MDLRSVQCFITVAETGSITRSAQVIGIAQPALTRHIKRLEDEFGIRFFSRVPRGVRLTANGREFLDHCRRIMAEVALTKRELMNKESQPAGSLLLGATATLARALVPGIVARSTRELPKVRLRIIERPSAALQEALHTGEVDMAILTNPDTGHSLKLEPLVSEPLSLITSSLPRGRRRAAKLEDLGDSALFVTPGMRHLIERQYGTRSKSLPITAEIESMETIRALVCAGIGSTLMPASAFNEEVAQKRCFAIALEKQEITRRLVLGVLMESAGNAAVKEMTRVIRTEVQLWREFMRLPGTG